MSKCGVHIVSMSFGFERPDHAVNTAIANAIAERQERIIFMAAASNSGGNSDVMWPAQHEFVFDIRATDHMGSLPRLNAPSGLGVDNVYGTLGENVEGAWPRSENGYKIDSGTSYATPIAAGIASLVLDAAKLSLDDEENYLKSNRFGNLLTKRGMHLVFKDDLMSQQMPTNIRYLRPHKFFWRNSEDRSYSLKHLVRKDD